MAKRAKPKDASQSRGVTTEDLRRVVADISKNKTQASNYAGLAGKATQSAVEQYGLEKTALTFVRRLNDMEEGKRQSVLRSLVDYSNKLGFFDQIDAFDDLLATLEEIVSRTHNSRGAERSDDPTISELTH